jgi:hypothetical protein
MSVSSDKPNSAQQLITSAAGEAASPEFSVEFLRFWMMVDVTSRYHFLTRTGVGQFSVSAIVFN